MAEHHVLKNFLRAIVDPQEPHIDIVAVHGLNPTNKEFHAETTWTAGDKLWLRDFLPQRLPKARILLFGYNSNVAFETSTAGVREQAGDLLNRLKAKRRDASERPLIFVCHSLGGIIVKRALVHAKLDDTYQAIRTATYGIVFFGTPHQGGNFVKLGDIASTIARGVLRNPKNTFLEALKANTLFADDLIQDFRHQLEDYYVLSFFETLPFKKLGLIVDQKSATLGLPGARERQIAMEADHVNICKFSQIGGDDYGQVVENLVEFAERAVKSVVERQRLESLNSPTSSHALEQKIHTFAPKEKISSRIPIPKAEFFGRQHESDSLRCFLEPEGAAKKGVVIWGLSGYGKTQLAIHYIYKFRTLYSSVLWIDASSKDSFISSFEEIASQRLGPHQITAVESPNSYLRQKTAINNLMAWLSQDTNKSWLMVFDSLDTLEDIDIRNYLPDCEHGNYIITTTRSDLHSPLKFHGIELEGMDDSAGSKILLNFLGNNLPHQSKNAAVAIARKLKGIPLAIEQAGAFLSSGVVSIHDYNLHFQKYLDDTLNVLPRGYRYAYEKDRTIYAALNIVYDALHPDSVKLLKLSVLLGYGEIPYALLAEVPLPEGNSEFLSNQASSSGDTKDLPDIPFWLIGLRGKAGDFGSAIEKLEQTCLMKFSRDHQDCRNRSYVIHEMVRTWILGKLSKEETSEYAVTAFALIGATLYDQSGLCSLQNLQKYTPRLNSILKIVCSSVCEEATRVPEGKYASLYGSVASGFGKFCRTQGKLHKAKELLAAALTYRMASEGSVWPAKRVHLAELEEAAVIEWRLGDLQEATEKYESLLNHCKRILGDDDNMAIDVGVCLCEIRERQDRESHALQRVIDARLSPKSVLREHLQHQAMDDEEWELKEGFDEAKNLLGDNDIETLQLAEKLAAYYRKRARPGEEEPLRELIWRGYSTRFKPTNPYAIGSLCELCKCYKETGKLSSELQGKLKLAPVWLGNSDSIEIQSLLLGAEESVIFSAALEGQVEVVDELLNQQIIDVNKRDHYGNTALNWAVEGGHQPMVELLLEKGADLNSHNKRGKTALHWAAVNGHEKVLPLLLMRGSDTAAKDNDGSTALHLAAVHGHEKVVELLLESGSDIAAKNKRGSTALLTALGQENMVQLLLNSGSDISAKDNEGYRALHSAAQSGHEKMVQLLLENGANIATKNYRQETALHLAAKYGHEEVLQLLLENGADTTAKNSKGETALHLAAEHRHEKIMQLLLENGADTIAKNRTEETALHLTTKYGHEKMVQLLLENGADTTAKNHAGETALHLAIEYGHEKMVQLLLENGADTTAKNRAEETALHLAIEYGHEKKVQLLLENGADATAKDDAGQTILHLAAKRGNEKIMRLLLENGADTTAKNYQKETPLHKAAELGYEKIVQLLLENGADIAAKDYLEGTALHKAIEYGYEKVVQLLLENGDDTVAKIGVFEESTLHLAVRYGNRKVVQLLLKNGADTAVKDCVGLTALDLAVNLKYMPIVGLLLENVSDMVVKRNDGWTALHWAAAKDYRIAVQLLLERGSDITARDNNENTALHLAALNGCEEVVQLLLSAGSGGDATAKDNTGQSALHLAAANGYEKVVQLLLSTGSDGDATAKDNTGQSALHLAAANGYENVVELLLDWGFDAASKDNLGRTPRDWAILKGHKRVARQLRSARIRRSVLGAFKNLY